jgi:hypothetical protein
VSTPSNVATAFRCSWPGAVYLGRDRCARLARKPAAVWPPISIAPQAAKAGRDSNLQSSPAQSGVCTRRGAALDLGWSLPPGKCNRSGTNSAAKVRLSSVRTTTAAKPRLELVYSAVDGFTELRGFQVDLQLNLAPALPRDSKFCSMDKEAARSAAQVFLGTIYNCTNLDLMGLLPSSALHGEYIFVVQCICMRSHSTCQTAEQMRTVR